MTAVVIEKLLPASVERAFAFITKRQHLVGWWGPEGATVPEEALDFSRTGPWFSVMVNAEKQRFKVSGQVTKVQAPNLVAFTWGWHDENGKRGPESHVTLSLTPLGPDQCRLTLSHADLADDDARKRHAQGWASTLRKLETAIGAKP